MRVLSAREQRRWQHLTGQLTDDALLSTLDARLNAASDAAASDATASHVAGSEPQPARAHRRRRAWPWFVLLLSALGWCLAILGATVNLANPAVGLCGLGLLLASYFLLVHLLTRRSGDRHHLP